MSFISIGLILAFVPTLLRNRIRANEAAAIGSLKTIAAGEVDYNNNSSPHTYTGDLNCLGGKPNPEVRFIDTALTSGKKSGYQFSLQVCPEPDENGIYWFWSATAWPIAYGETGKRTFYIDETFTIRARDIHGKKGNIFLPKIEDGRK